MNYTYENLKAGQIYKSYRDICKTLGEEIKGGDSKKAQIKEWERFFSYHKDGNKFVIDEIYETPKQKLDNRFNGNNRKYQSILESHPDVSSSIVGLSISELNMMTQNSNETVNFKCNYCSGIFSRKIKYACRKNNVRCDACLLSKNAKRIYDTLRLLDIDMTLEYEFEELVGIGGGNLRFDFGIHNNSNLMGLIEYDGAYHDINETIITHDKLKNDYCKQNNIPLLRIHHTENDELINKLVIYLEDLSFNINYKTINKIIHNEEIEKLQEQLNYYENKALEIKERLIKLTTQGEI